MPGMKTWGVFGPEQVIADDVDGATAALSADLDGDGNPDILAGAYNGDRITWYKSKPVIGVRPEGVSRESSASTSQFVLQSQGVATTDTTVAFTLDGNATLGVDYLLEGAETLNGNQGTAVLPAGATRLSLTVRPMGDSRLESEESVTLSLLPGETYGLQPSQTTSELKIVEEPLPVEWGFSSQVFAQDLNYPNGMVVIDDNTLLVGVNDGSPAGYSSGSSELLLLKDTNGDGVADQQQLMATGLPATTTHIQQIADLVFVSSQDGLGRVDRTTKVSVFRKSGSVAGGEPFSLSLLGSLDFEFTDSLHRAVALTLREIAPEQYEIFVGFGAEGNNEASNNAVVLSSSNFNLSDINLEADSIYKIALDNSLAIPQFSEFSKIAAGLRNPADLVFSNKTGELLFIENGIDGIDGNPGEPLTADELNRLTTTEIGGDVEHFGFTHEGTAYRTGDLIDGNGNPASDSPAYVNPTAVFRPLNGSESEGPASLSNAPAGFGESFENGVFIGFFGEFGKAGQNNAENPVLFHDLDSGESRQFISNDATSIGHPITLAVGEEALFLADLSSAGSLFGPAGLGTGVIYRMTQKNSILGSNTPEQLTGTSEDDFIQGLASNDKLFGGRGDDDLQGGLGRDNLRGELGADRLDGGAGSSDLADYVTSTAAVQVDLLSGVGAGGHAAGDTLINIERLRGSRFDDQLLGDDNDNALSGLGGNDAIFGRGGNDYLRGDAGADQLDGGDGRDFADYINSPGAVTVSLATGIGSDSDAAGDQLVNIEDLRGSGLDDELTGDFGNNRLWGGNGDDLLAGGAGTDFLRGGLGSDVLDGGLGNDWAEYASSNAAVTVDLLNNVATGGEAQGDSFIDIEFVQGSRFDDVLTGDDGANTLVGAAGADELFGEGGTDNLRGGLGADLLTGGAGRDRFTYRSALFGTDTILDFDDGVDQIDLRQSGLTLGSFTVSTEGADTLLFLDSSNTILLKGIDDSLITAADFIS